jgi:Pao retrotransposon peptidase
MMTPGIHYDTTRAMFFYQEREDKEERYTLTKRKLLSEASKVFDLLWFLAAALLKAKILFQIVCNKMKD